ncbi:MFS transporter [Singulisphaera sp. PoT]|uniref:MFS transporter n=1 Tax=Singulisphaera sp. PoT TaxID=3411797 RepID=UPI003BF55BFD
MIPRPTLWAMAAGCGLAVANNYYAQPLLAAMGREFDVPDRRMGLISMASQVGYAAGLLLFVPLGDLRERRSQILTMLGAVTVALVAVALSPNFTWLVLANLAVGITTIAPQLLIPFAATLAPPAERGRVVGFVMSGLLIGILCARTVSGYVGDTLGWRAMYWIAAGQMVVLAITLRVLLPRSVPEPTGLTYGALLRSLVDLLRSESILRQSCTFGALSFAAFSAFWTTLTFYLSGPPWGYSSRAIGLFGLVGVVGALVAPVVGRLGDKGTPTTTIGLGFLCILLSYLCFYAFGLTLAGMVVGVILLDLGAQACHISNQSRIYAIRPEARSRLNTVYMVTYFVGGAVGSFAGAYAWSVGGWPGVCLVGSVLPILGIVLFFLIAPRRPVAVR